MATESTPRATWGSRFGFIMVTAGAAVGLGNIWKFPYMAGNNGGGAFVIAYLVFVAAIGVPAMVAELLLGRRGRHNPVNTMAILAKEAKQPRAWQQVGWLGCITLLMVLSFYSVVAGWSIAYILYALKGLFVNASPETIVQIWQNLLDSPLELTLWHTIFMILTMAVVAFGVNKGIENSSRILMPALFLILIFLVIYAAMTGDFKHGFQFLFAFKPNDLTNKAIIDALGQAFFSLATGAGAILIYGSYLKKDVNIVETVSIIAFLNVLVALFSGLAIFPIVFAHNLTPEVGPGLMFHVLPIAFSHMPGSMVVSLLFFVLLLFAAWTSSISMGEPIVALMEERWRIPRMRGSFYVGALAWSFGLLSVLSFNLWSHVKVFDRWGLFEVLTDLPTNIFLPIGALAFCIFTGWVMKKKDVREEFHPDSPFIYALFRFCIRYVAPIGILVVLLVNVLN